MIDAPVMKSGNGSRQMTAEELEQMLGRIVYGTLSFANDDGWPDSRVFNFTRYEGNFYFHCAKNRGEKLKYLKDGNKVCISFYEVSPDVGLRRYCQHNSALIYGRIYRLDDPNSFEVSEEEWNAMSKLCVDAGTAFKCVPERMKNSIKGIACFKIVPEYQVGKFVLFTSLREKSYIETLHLNEK